MPDHLWTYQTESLVGTTYEVGPITEATILGDARDGKLKPSTLVMSPSRTKGHWLQVQQIAGLMQAIAKGNEDRQAAKQQADQERATKQSQAVAQRQMIAAQQQQLADRASIAKGEAARRVASLSHCQNIDLVRSIVEKVHGLLTPNELVQYVAVQQKPVVNISPDALVATNKRLIFYRPKLLGRFEFGDYQWLDLFNAHVQKNLFGAVFSAQHVNGQQMSMDYLPEESALARYRIAQEREEAARLQRQQLHFDYARAGASQVNVNIPQAFVAAAPAPSGPTPSAPGDLVQRLQTLKAMLEQGLIDQSDFENRKREILASV